jgi:hypothetical protein
MHTYTMSPVSFGPLSQKNSCNPDRLGHGVGWVTLVSVQFLHLAGSVRNARKTINISEKPKKSIIRKNMN